MKEKGFEFGAGKATVKELTVGQMKKVKEKLKEDDFEASILMAEMATGKESAFVDRLTMSELNTIGDWLANPTD